LKNVAKLIERHGGMVRLVAGNALKIEAPGFMALHVECIGASPHGPGLVLVSVCHYGEQNGDAMRDPDMVFDVLPTADAQLGWRSGNWRPVSYRNDYVGAMREAVYADDRGRVMVRPALVKELKAFARTWDRNLKAQGFLDVPPKVAA
jgi:hypothetical protein